LAAIHDPNSPFVRSPEFLTEGGWLASEHLEKMILLNLPQPNSTTEDYRADLRDHISATTGVRPKSISFPRGTARKHFHATVILPQQVDATVLNSIQSKPFHNTIILAGGTATPALHRCTKCHKLGHKHRNCKQPRQTHMTIHLKNSLYSYQLQRVQKALHATNICLGLPCIAPSTHSKTLTLSYDHPSDFHKVFKDPFKAFSTLSHQNPTHMYQWTHDSLCLDCHHPATSRSNNCSHHKPTPPKHRPPKKPQQPSTTPPTSPTTKPTSPIPEPKNTTTSTETEKTTPTLSPTPPTNSNQQSISHPAPDQKQQNPSPSHYQVLSSDLSPEIDRGPSPIPPTQAHKIQPSSTGNSNLDQDLLYFPKLLDPETISFLSHLSDNPTTQILPHAKHHHMGLYCHTADATQKLTYSWGKESISSSTWHNTLTKTLDEIQNKIQPQLPPLNSCLFNHFKNGSDKTPQHSDTKQNSKEPDYVVLVAVGHPRPFIFSNKNSNIEVTITLNPGDVLILTQGCNVRWYHKRPPVPKIKYPSSSFTFRDLPKPQPSPEPVAEAR
jgi:alkylated DNA repair dioxygenase AlkB